MITKEIVVHAFLNDKDEPSKDYTLKDYIEALGGGDFSRMHKSGFYASYFDLGTYDKPPKRKLYLHDLTLINRSGHISISNSGGSMRNWYGEWAGVISVIRKIASDYKKFKDVFMFENGPTLHIGKWAYRKSEQGRGDMVQVSAEQSKKYNGWYCINCHLGGFSEVFKDENFVRHLNDMDIYESWGYDEGRLAFFYKKINEKNIKRTMKIFKFFKGVERSVIQRMNSARIKYFVKSKPWTDLKKIS